MFSQNGEICLQNTCQSVAHYQSQTIFKQNANDIKNIWPQKITWRSKKGSYLEKSTTPSPTKKSLVYVQRRSHGAKGIIDPKLLAFLAILCFERRCPKQNTVARLKSRYFSQQKFGAWLRHVGTRRGTRPKKLEAINVTVTSRVVAIALGFSPIGVIKRALRNQACLESSPLVFKKRAKLIDFIVKAQRRLSCECCSAVTGNRHKADLLLLPV